MVSLPLSGEHDLGDTRRLEGMSIEVSVGVDDVPEWDTTSPLITNKIFELSGESNTVATKIDQHHDYNNCLWTNRVMESGKYQMSLNLIKEDEDPSCLMHFFGLVREGAVWNGYHAYDTSTDDAWYMYDDGDAYRVLGATWLAVCP